ncbi:MAG: cation transporter [Candidatus Omnitrophica bacterium]|nr:cation transporter [Candidatus Omnitrophota bacterium]
MDRYDRAKFGAMVGIFGNILLGVLKLVVGVFGKSTALIVDSFHSFSDTVSSVIVLLGIEIASKPEDPDHPYGHGKAESIAAWAISSFLICLGAYLGFSAFRDVASREALSAPAQATLWVALFSVLCKEGMYQYKVRLGKKIHSTSITVDAWHHRSDALSSVVAFGGIALAEYGGGRFAYADRVAAVIIALMICWVGVMMLRQSTSELMDGVVDQEVRDRIRSIALSIPGVKDIEKILVRKAGLHYLANIHVEVDKDMSVEKSHHIATEVKNAIRQSFPEVSYVLVHIEPYYPGDH